MRAHQQISNASNFWHWLLRVLKLIIKKKKRENSHLQGKTLNREVWNQPAPRAVFLKAGTFPTAFLCHSAIADWNKSPDLQESIFLCVTSKTLLQPPCKESLCSSSISYSPAFYLLLTSFIPILPTTQRPTKTSLTCACSVLPWGGAIFPCPLKACQRPRMQNEIDRQLFLCLVMLI